MQFVSILTKQDSIPQVKSTPLHYAASGGHLQIVKLLIDAGALISSKDKVSSLPKITINCITNLTQWLYL